VEIGAWRVNGEPVSFERAVNERYEPFAVGDRWGAPWDTVWWGADPELLIDLGFDEDEPVSRPRACCSPRKAAP
jgi:alpha-mannosidase